jgi:predicted NAD/FAD-binding protein
MLPIERFCTGTPLFFLRTDVPGHPGTISVPRGGRETDPVTLTYDMTRLQHLPADAGRFCVTLNPWREIAPPSVIRSFVYSHPMYTFDALATQDRLSTLNEKRNTYFCGSYFGYGFHEDAVRSAVEVARHFGIEL